MPKELIGNWDKEKLSKFISGRLAAETIPMPKALTVTTITVTDVLRVRGRIEISPQAKAYLLAQGL